MMFKEFMMTTFLKNRGLCNIKPKTNETKNVTECTSTHIISKQNETAAHMTTTESIMFQKSLRYDPGWNITPKSMTC